MQKLHKNYATVPQNYAAFYASITHNYATFTQIVYAKITQIIYAIITQTLRNVYAKLRKDVYAQYAKFTQMYLRKYYAHFPCLRNYFTQILRK